LGAVSSKFELLGTCYSSSPSSSFAYIHLPDNTFQWVGVGAEIGHVTVKEIRKGSITYSDGSHDVEMNAESTPETSTLLETGKAPKEVASGKSQSPSDPQASGRASKLKPPASSSANAATGPVKGTQKATGRAGDPRSSVASSRAAALGEPLPSAQMSKEEQENLSRLGNRLKEGAGADANNAAAGKLISDFKSSQANPSQTATVPNPVEPVDANKGAWKDNMKEEARRQWQKRLTVPRPTQK
jgi:hypothetical protein